MGMNRRKIGCAAIFQNQELLKCLVNESSIYSAEVTAIDQAMNIIDNHKSSKFINYSNSKSVLLALQNKYTLSNLITKLQNKVNTLSKNNSIILTGYQATMVYMEMKEQTKLSHTLIKNQVLKNSYMKNGKNNRRLKCTASLTIYKMLSVSGWQAKKEIEKKW